MFAPELDQVARRERHLRELKHLVPQITPSSLKVELRQARPKSACTATNRRLVMSLVLLLAASEGHVRLNFIDGLDQPIRNAGTATGNGRASVAGGLRMVKT